MPSSPPALRVVPADPDESDLVHRAARGDAQAFRELYDRHAPRLLRLLARLLGSRERAEDALQETFVRAHRSLAAFAGASAFGSWLTRIALNAGLNACRGRRPLAPLAEAESTPAEGVPLEARDLARRVLALLAELAPKKRAVLLLHEVEGYTTDEMAALLGESKSAVLNRLARARRELVALARERGLSVSGEEEGT